MTDLRSLSTPTAVVTAGASLLADALEEQGVATVRVILMISIALSFS